MQTVFSGEIRVDYAQFYVESNDQPEDSNDYDIAGQANGLCGAVIPGHLKLTTGTTYGGVLLTVKFSDDAPPLGDEWEDIVEVSFYPRSGRTVVHQWDGSTVCQLPLAELADYRVRYSAFGMDAGHAQCQPDPDEAPRDRYLLQFWPAPEAPDAVLRQNSGSAAYWHSEARATPPPPPELVAEWAADRELDRLDAAGAPADED